MEIKGEQGCVHVMMFTYEAKSDTFCYWKDSIIPGNFGRVTFSVHDFPLSLRAISHYPCALTEAQLAATRGGV
jgi:hypothetical protein